MRVHWPRPPADCPVHRMQTPVSTGELPGPVDVLICGRPRGGELEALVPGGVILVPYAGIPQSLRVQLAIRPDVRVYNLHDNAVDVAELAVGLLFALARRIVPYDRALRGNQWMREGGLRLAGRRALVLGYGAVGQAVASRLHAMGLYLSATRARGPFGHDKVAEVHPPQALDMLLPSAEVLVNCLPHTEQTDGLLDAGRLALLPRGALLINVGRASTVDEVALFDALRSEMLGGAGLDVWWGRRGSAPSQLDFASLDSVVMSPHRAGHVDETEEDRAAAVDSFLRALAADELVWEPVNVDRGY